MERPVGKIRPLIGGSPLPCGLARFFNGPIHLNQARFGFEGWHAVFGSYAHNKGSPFPSPLQQILFFDGHDCLMILKP